MQKRYLIPLLTWITFQALAQPEHINYKIKSEETFRVTPGSKKNGRYFPANATVTMADGTIKEIANVQVGEYVQTLEKGRSIITQVKQIDVYNHPSSALTAVYLRPVQGTSASNGSRAQALLLEVTPYHHVQTGKGRKRIKNLSRKDVLFHFEPATGGLSAWKVGAIQENARKVNKAYNLKTELGTYLVENVVVN
jgi:hypothetical protein